MSDNDTTKTIRLRLTDADLRPDNREFNDEGRIDFALLNGREAPNSGPSPIPEATSRIRVRFPEGTKMLEMAQFMDALESSMREFAKGHARTLGL